MKKLAVTLMFLYSADSWARPQTDVLVMKNGDRFTCEIKRLERGVLYASLDYVDGTVSFQWSKVARVESNQLFVVHTQAGVIYEGTLRTPEGPGDNPIEISVVEPNQPVEKVERTEVVQLSQTAERFWKRLSGSFDAGFLYAKGNDSTQYNLGARASLNRELWSVEGELASSLSKSAGLTAATHNEARLKALRRVGNSQWFGSGGTNFLQSSQQGIDIQTTVGATAGRFLKDSNNARIAVSAGLAWQQTRYQANAQSQDAPNALAGLLVADLHLFRFKKTSLDATASMLPILTQWGRVRTYVNTAYSIQIINNLWWRLSFYGNWDNRPPPTFSASDYGASASISWSFN